MGTPKKEQTSAGSEVPLGLEGEKCEGDCDCSSNAGCQNDSIFVVESANGPQHKSLTN